MSGVGEQRFVGVLYELPSNCSHIMNVALDVPAEVSGAFGVRDYMRSGRASTIWLSSS